MGDEINNLDSFLAACAAANHPALIFEEELIFLAACAAANWA
tara:strand:+ start:1869 stop:1994 length:126 start_codon:yes stop_codon:yes gene_type:complete